MRISKKEAIAMGIDTGGTQSPHKYRAVKTAVDGIVFASKSEAARYAELKLLAQAGKIQNLQLQVKYPIFIRDTLVCNWIADFVYTERGETVVEDRKGFRTPVYRLKKKLVEAAYGIKIKET